MSNLNIKRVRALPGVVEANTLYMVINASDTKLIDLYVSGSDSSDLKHILTKEDIAGLITASISSLSALRVIPNIAARDALKLTANTMALVLDATGDLTGLVSKGGAMYLWSIDTLTWTKVSEYESMDMSLKWGSIDGKPSSTVADIDLAVTNSHTHSNKTLLDKLTADVDGNLMYDSKYASTNFSVVEW